MSETTKLTGFKRGESGKVKAVEGGHGLINRLSAIGIRPGTELKVVNSSFFRGPVTVRVGNSHVALGHGMAGKVTMEKSEKDT